MNGLIEKGCPDCITRQRLKFFIENTKNEGKFWIWHWFSIVFPVFLLVLCLELAMFWVLPGAAMAVLLGFFLGLAMLTLVEYGVMRYDRSKRNKVRLILFPDKDGHLHLHEQNKVIINPLDNKLYTADKQLIEGQCIVIQAVGGEFVGLVLSDNKWPEQWPNMKKAHAQIKVRFGDWREDWSFEKYLSNLAFDSQPYMPESYGFCGLDYEFFCFFHSRLLLDFSAIVARFKQFNELRILFDVLYRSSVILESKVEQTKEITGSPVGIFVREYLQVLNRYILSKRSKVILDVVFTDQAKADEAKLQRQSKEDLYAVELSRLLPEYKPRSVLRAEKEVRVSDNG